MEVWIFIQKKIKDSFIHWPETRRDARSRQMAVTTDVSMKVVVDLQI